MRSKERQLRGMISNGYAPMVGQPAQRRGPFPTTVAGVARVGAPHLGAPSCIVRYTFQPTLQCAISGASFSAQGATVASVASLTDFPGLSGVSFSGGAGSFARYQTPAAFGSWSLSADSFAILAVGRLGALDGINRYFLNKRTSIGWELRTSTTVGRLELVADGTDGTVNTAQLVADYRNSRFLGLFGIDNNAGRNKLCAYTEQANVEANRTCTGGADSNPGGFPGGSGSKGSCAIPEFAYAVVWEGAACAGFDATDLAAWITYWQSLGYLQ